MTTYETVQTLLNLNNLSQIKMIFGLDLSNSFVVDHGASTEFVDVITALNLQSVVESPPQYTGNGLTVLSFTNTVVVESGTPVETVLILISSVLVSMVYHNPITSPLNLISNSPGIRKFSYVVPVEPFDIVPLVEALAAHY